MATTSYEEAVRITQQMTSEERRRFQLELHLAAHPGSDAATIMRCHSLRATHTLNVCQVWS
jgi:hypothetical protein